MQVNAIINAVRSAGVVGAGGAGFPSHLKLQSRVELVIANGCECEPLLCSDQYLMEHEAEAVVRGLLLTIQVTKARQGIIALKEKYSRSLKALEKAACTHSRIKFHLLANYYPLGDEQVLTYLLTKRLVPAGGIPPQVGVLVHNVTTLAQIARACEGQALTRRKLAILGEVAEPKVMEVPLGTTVRQAIDWAGGTTREDIAVIAGGPMMGHLISDLDTPISKTTSALIVLPVYHPLVISKRKKPLKIQRQAQAYCQGCGACQTLCPRRQLGHPLRPQRLLRAANYRQAVEFSSVSGVLACSQCGVCGLYACPMGLSPSVINVVGAPSRRELSRQDAAPTQLQHPKKSSAWPYPLGIPTPRLLHRLGLGKYNFLPPLDKGRYTPPLVRLPLKQHWGEPAVPTIKAGDRVQEGSLLAEIPAGKPGARVHASISGRVKEISKSEILLAA